MKINPMLLMDFYKAGHVFQYPQGTEYVYSTWTPRSSKNFDNGKTKEVVVFGHQGFIQEYLIDFFNDNFFYRNESNVVDEYVRIMKCCLGQVKPNVKHIIALHRLGYLPIEIKGLEEGTLCPIRVPALTIVNTLPEFYWLTNALETLMSCELWQASTSATIAYEYKKILEKYALKTVGNTNFVPFQAHDFSMRGHSAWQSSAHSGCGHLTSFVGTDTIPAIIYAEAYYGANVETELVGCSVNASEHSVMCAGGKDNEYETYRRLIQDVYPSGIVSLVSDTWDLWSVITDTLVKLKDTIMARDGKLVIRPDSGNPVDIICGTNSKGLTFTSDSDAWSDFKLELEYYDDEIICVDGVFYRVDGMKDLLKEYGWECIYSRRLTMEDLISGGSCGVLYPVEVCDSVEVQKGVIELLWDIFGGTFNEKGYKELDSHIGAIYGDSITLERAEQICQRLEAKGFASTNIVFGVGSFTYQYQTRDTFGWAVKSTAVTINGEESAIFKDPITDDGTKKSATGRVRVVNEGDVISLIDSLTESEADEKNLLKRIFYNGVVKNKTTLQDIREKLNTKGV